MFFVILCSWSIEFVWEFASMAKSQRQIDLMFHPIDKDERLLSIASVIEVLNAQERDGLGRIGESPNIYAF